MKLEETVQQLKDVQDILIKRIARLETERKAEKPKVKRKSSYVPKYKIIGVPTREQINARIDRKHSKKKAAWVTSGKILEK